MFKEILKGTNQLRNYKNLFFEQENTSFENKLESIEYLIYNDNINMMLFGITSQNGYLEIEIQNVYELGVIMNLLKEDIIKIKTKPNKDDIDISNINNRNDDFLYIDNLYSNTVNNDINEVD